MSMKISVFEPVVVLVALLISLQCKVYAEMVEKDIFEGTESVESIEEALRPQRSMYPEDGFLAGETTPVWLAHEGQPNMVYKRLDKEIVKKAMDYFKSENFQKDTKYRRNTDEDISLTTTTEEFIPGVIPLESEEEKKEDFLYPSLLVTMEYENSWPANADAEEKMIFNKILYALAYWNEVSVQLRPIRHPGVRLRIAGIVIAKRKDAIHPRVKSNRGRIWDSLLDGLQYWDDYRRNHEDFRQGTFNVLAAMTDEKPYIWTGWGYSMPGPNCDSTLPFDYYPVKQLSGLMVYDDQHFSGIQQTVAEMAHMMGRSKTGMSASVDATMLTRQDLADIRNSLQKATCWQKPNEGHLPGKPVETILPEDIYHYYNV